MKYIADTNVVSELIRRRPDPSVVRWVEDHDPDICISWVTVAELRKGVALHPDPVRRVQLANWVDRIVADYLEEESSRFNDSTAKALAGLVAKRTSAGRATSWPDTVIAAKAEDRGLTVATRNTQDFPDTPTVNPWNEANPGDDARGLKH